MEHETLPDGDALSGDGLALDRRTVLGLLGAGGVGAATGTARGNPGGGKGGEGPTRKWNQDIDARGDDLFDLRSIEVDHVYMAARKADVIIWKDGEGVFHADSSEGMVESGEDIIEVTQAAVGSLTDDRDWKERVVVVSPSTVGPVSADEDVPEYEPSNSFERIDLPSYTVLNIPARMRVADEGNQAQVVPVMAQDVEHVEIPNLHVVGNSVRHVPPECPEPPAGEHHHRNDRRRTHGKHRRPYQRLRRRPRRGHDPLYGYQGRRRLRRELGRARLRDLCGRPHSGRTGARQRGRDRLWRPAQRHARRDSRLGRRKGHRPRRGVRRVLGRKRHPRRHLRPGHRPRRCPGHLWGLGLSRHHHRRGQHLGDARRDLHRGQSERHDPGRRHQELRLEGRPDPFERRLRPRPHERRYIANLRTYDDRPEDEREQSYGIYVSGAQTSNVRITNCDVRGGGTDQNIRVDADEIVLEHNHGGGLETGTVTLEGGTEPAAVVEGVSPFGYQRPGLRANPVEAAETTFAYDHYFVWDADAGTWNLHFEWKVDPEDDLEVQYVVDNPRADLGEPAGDDGGELTELEEGTYRVTAALNDDDIVMSADEATDGSNVYNQTWGEAPVQTWEATEFGEGVFRIGPEGSDDLALEAADGETETGTNLVLGTWEDADYQRFEAVPRAPDLYTLEPTHADLAVDVWEVDPGPGADLRHWTPTGSNNQLWAFQDPDA